MWFILRGEDVTSINKNLWISVYARDSHAKFTPEGQIIYFSFLGVKGKIKSLT